MAKIRTVEQLVDAVDSDLGWRKREMTTLASALASARAGEADALLRGAWTLLYAHWEGFIKNASQQYVEFVGGQRLRIDELAPPFAAMALRSQIVAAGVAKQGALHSSLVEQVRAGDQKAKLSTDSATIRTNANLNYATYRDIMASIGCTVSPDDNLETLIDSMLLRHRNDIAHGQYLTVTVDNWEVLRAKVREVMDHLRTEIENGAALGSYRAVPLTTPLV